jgi:hypothetical protein
MQDFEAAFDEVPEVVSHPSKESPSTCITNTADLAEAMLRQLSSTALDCLLQGLRYHSTTAYIKLIVRAPLGAKQLAPLAGWQLVEKQMLQCN